MNEDSPRGRAMHWHTFHHKVNGRSPLRHFLVRKDLYAGKHATAHKYQRDNYGGPILSCSERCDHAEFLGRRGERNGFSADIKTHNRAALFRGILFI